MLSKTAFKKKLAAIVLFLQDSFVFTKYPDTEVDDLPTAWLLENVPRIFNIIMDSSPSDFFNTSRTDINVKDEVCDVAYNLCKGYMCASPAHDPKNTTNDPRVSDVIRNIYNIWHNQANRDIAGSGWSQWAKQPSTGDHTDPAFRKHGIPMVPVPPPHHFTGQSHLDRAVSGDTRRIPENRLYNQPHSPQPFPTPPPASYDTLADYHYAYGQFDHPAPDKYGRFSDPSGYGLRQVVDIAVDSIAQLRFKMHQMERDQMIAKNHFTSLYFRNAEVTNLLEKRIGELLEKIVKLEVSVSKPSAEVAEKATV